jgi:membrane protein CcdC involved in cytochrome C biogenesis
MFLLFNLILYSQSDFDLKKKKKWSKRKKNMPINLKS